MKAKLYLFFMVTYVVKLLFIWENSMYWPLSWGGWWASWKFMGSDQRISKGDTSVGAYDRLPDQMEEGDEAFSRQLDSSKSQAWVLVRDFIYPDICWRSSTAKYKQFREFLWKHWWQLPVTGSGGSHKEWWPARPRINTISFLEVWRLEAGLAAVTMKMWSSVSGKEEEGQQVRLQPWTSGELMLAASGMFLEESHWNRPCREEWSKRVNCYPKMTSSRTNNDAYQWARNQAKGERDLH